MSVFADFHFLRPAWLTTIPIVLWVWWRLTRLHDPLQGWRQLMDAELLGALTTGERGQGIRRLYGLLCAWLVAIAALAGPTWRPEPSPFADNPVPVMVLLSASESMNLSDVSPSRMERARLKIIDLATLRKGQPLGLIVYAGSAHLVLPPTRDTSVVADMAMEIRPEIMPRPGNNPAAALELARDTLGAAGGAVVVVTDSVPNPTASRITSEAHTSNSRVSTHFLIVADPSGTEFETAQNVINSFGGQAVAMSADSSDVQKLVNRTAAGTVAVSGAGGEVRWEDSGWWAVPLLVLMSLTGFRRIGQGSKKEDSE